MKITNKLFVIVSIAMMFILSLSGCGATNTVESFVVSNDQYTDKAAIEEAEQSDHLTVGENVYACVYFIESPKGMEYTGKWYLDGNEIKTDTQATTSDMAGTIVYTLDADNVKAGNLKFEVVYNETVLCSKELPVE